MSQLRLVLRTLELDLDIENLSNAELDVLSAAIQISDASPVSLVASTQILEHELVQQLGKSTIYRSLASLEDRGFLVPRKSGYNAEYSLNLGSA
ncbi:MAG TPA: hypothetical protein VJ906_12055 [Roseovarius sp.]|nr:hypothetical protein [Roseovarius sp.]